MMKLKSQKVPCLVVQQSQNKLLCKYARDLLSYVCLKISLRQSKTTTGERKSRMHEVPPAAASTILGALQCLLMYSTRSSRVIVLQSKIDTNRLYTQLEKVLGPVVQMVDNSIHWVNLYPFNNAIGFPCSIPVKRRVSGQ